MATARLDLRLDVDVKRKFEKAALFNKSTLTDYIIRIAEKDADEVISKHEKFVVQNDIFESFMKACDKAQKPNDALVEAARYAKEQGF